MKNNSMIPFYGSDGASLGFREFDAAKRLVAEGKVKPAYGRKGHLKAIFEQQLDGATPVALRPTMGTNYSYRQPLKSGAHCWALQKLDVKDDEGTVVDMRSAYQSVLRECSRSEDR